MCVNILMMVLLSSIADVTTLALQMANSMAVSEGALMKDMAVLQVNSMAEA
jgi:hypothetical protein